MKRSVTTATLVFAAAVAPLPSCDDVDASDREVAPLPPPDASVAGETPPLGATARSATSADGTYVVAWEPVGGAIPDAEPFAIQIEVRRADGGPIGPRAQVSADAEMPHHGHGMNLVPTVRAIGPGAGRFVAENMLLHMSGRWILAIDVEEDGVAERTQWDVEID